MSPGDCDVVTCRRTAWHHVHVRRAGFRETKTVEVCELHKWLDGRVLNARQWATLLGRLA